MCKGGFIKKTFSEILKEIRKSKNLSMSQMAEILQVSATTISNWEKGKTKPRLDGLGKVAIHFDVKLKDILRH